MITGGPAQIGSQKQVNSCLSYDAVRKPSKPALGTQGPGNEPFRTFNVVRLPRSLRMPDNHFR